MLIPFLSTPAPRASGNRGRTLTKHVQGKRLLVACTEGVKRAEKLIRPGALMRDVNNAAFEPMIERGMLTSPEARTMPYNWAPMDDGSARLIT